MISYNSRRSELDLLHGYRVVVLSCVIAATAAGTWWIVSHSTGVTSASPSPDPGGVTRTPVAERTAERFATWKIEPESSRNGEIASPRGSAADFAPPRSARHAGWSAVAAYERGAKLQNLGNHDAALEFFLEAVELDAENVGYLKAAGLMASRIGDISQAAGLFERALAIQEHILGPDDPEVADTLSLLGAIYRDQQRYLEAEAAFLRALAIDEAAYGGQHFEVSRALSDLASLYQLEGRYDEAIALLEAALEIEEHVWGPQHANVASRSSSLGIAYQKEGRTEDVEALLERALFLREQTFGVDHPNTTGALTSLADFYRKHERYAEAEPLLLRALAVHAGTLESDDPRLAMDMANLGVLYLSQAQYDQAAPYYERALLIEKVAQWSDTPQVSVGINHLARTAGARGRYDEADAIYQWALGVSESVLGPNDANTKYLRDRYGEYLHILGREDAAAGSSNG